MSILLSNYKFGAKILISKVGSVFFAQNISIYACFRELLMDFIGQYRLKTMSYHLH